MLNIRGTFNIFTLTETISCSEATKGRNYSITMLCKRLQYGGQGTINLLNNFL